MMPELAQFVQWFTDAEDSTDIARAVSQTSRDFYDGHQWTEEEKQALDDRDQLAVVYNRVKRKVDHLTGLEKSLRTSAKAFPRTPNQEKDSEAATDAVRFVMDKNVFDQERSDAFEELIIEGTCGFEIIVTGKGKNKSVKVRRIPWNRIGGDPHSVRRDWSDANYKFVVVWSDLEFAKARYPGNAQELDSLMSSATSTSTTYDDVPRKRFVDVARQRVRIISMYYRVPADNDRGYDWEYVEFTNGITLKKAAPSPFLDDEKLTQCGYEFQSAFIDRDGNRYGLVKEMMDPQKEVNARRSKFVHQISVRQTAAEQGAFDDADEMREQLAKPHGHINVNPGYWDRWKMLDTRDMEQGQFGLLEEAKREIDDIGPDVFLTGKDSAIDASGRALQSRQQAQMTGLGTLFDGLRQLQMRVYEQAWYRARQFWTGEKWVRVTDDNSNVRFSMVNKTLRSLLKEQGQEFFFNTDGTIASIDSADDPRLNKRVANDLSKMHVDFELEDVPDTVTLQQEQFQVFAELYRANPQEVDFTDLVELSALRSDKKEKFLARKRGEDLTPQEQQAIQQRQQQAQQQQDIENAKTVADTQKSAASASKTQIEALKALQELNRTAQLPVRG